MAYGDDWEREFLDRMHRWRDARWRRESWERDMSPDERLDEVGWDIFYCAVSRGMSEHAAAALAMDGNYRQRRRVRDDMLHRQAIALEHRLRELNPLADETAVWETQAPQQLEFWRSHLRSSEYVYFIQSGPDGPVKIGLSNNPGRRLPQLQTGNPDELQLRHVLPGGHSVEERLHRRFEPARIRGEWFGREYLPIILAFAGGLADRMIHAYDGSGSPPLLSGGDVRTEGEIERIRRDIERLWRVGHDVAAIAEYTWLDVEEVEIHLEDMRRSPVWDVHTRGGCYFAGGRVIPRSPRPRPRRRSSHSSDDT
jgi:hypothetical protein